MTNSTATNKTNTPDYEVAVIGAGPGGIAAGVMLKKAGIDNFIMIERESSVGGSWRDNDYPGIGVDVPCFSYQYSFAPKADWSRLFPKGDEVCQYHVDVAKRFKLIPHLKFDTNIEREVWLDEQHYWQLHTQNNEVITARFVLNAVGAFIRPKQNDGLPGLATFKGKVMKPTQWDNTYDLKGKRVAVIGTGASSVQISPAIAPEVKELAVFQRTPVYCFPKPDYSFPTWVQTGLRIPGSASVISASLLVGIEVALRFLLDAPLDTAKRTMFKFDERMKKRYQKYVKNIVKDPETAAALTPSYGPAAKRPTLSNLFLPVFNRENTHLITTPIETITAKGIRTTDGVEHEFDMIVVATGYELFSDPESYVAGTIMGRFGFDLGKFYEENKLQAYESVSLPQLPNRWMLVGPYSWTGTGWHFMVETSARHAIRVIKNTRRKRSTLAEVKQTAHESYHKRLMKRGRAIQYYYTELNKGLRTYYVNSQGDMPYIRPSTAFEGVWRSYRFPLNHYRYERLSDIQANSKTNSKKQTRKQKKIEEGIV